MAIRSSQTGELPFDRVCSSEIERGIARRGTDRDRLPARVGSHQLQGERLRIEGGHGRDLAPATHVGHAGDYFAATGAPRLMGLRTALAARSPNAITAAMSAIT